MTQKCKILLLTDINSSTEKIVKNGVNLAKIVDGKINLFCVKKATDIVEKESQLSAMRTINKKFIEADNKIKQIIEEQSKSEEIKIDYKISFGNLKNEISQQIMEINPDIIVLGKNKSKVLSFIGDNIIKHVLKEYSGTVMITSDNNLLKASSDITLGLLNNLNTFSNRFAETIISYSNNSLKALSINDDKLGSENKVNLLFINRDKQETKSNIKKLIKNLDCSLILTT